MSPRILSVLAVAFGLLTSSNAEAEVPVVVASIKPIHSLVAGVMAGVGEPTLLVKGGASPHTYALKPSDAATLERADLVFWVGEGLEMFLVKPLQSLSDESRIVELADTAGLVLLPPREGGLWEPDLDEHEHADAPIEGQGEQPGEGEHHEHGAFDVHLWLDPRNAKLMVERIATALAARDPEHAATYRANGDALEAALDTLDTQLDAELASVKPIPFIVFHDAYQYFERRYGLSGVGSITVSPEQPPGVRRIAEIQEKIAGNGARCVFREPNFEPALVETVTAGTQARTGVLDPEGAALVEGPRLYFDLMQSLADSLKSCLAASS